MKTIKTSNPKGMRDLITSKMILREYILDIMKGTFEKYGFGPISTPAMENIETLNGKYGDEGDRLIFKVLKSGNFFSEYDSEEDQLNYKKIATKISDKALRYDLTVPLARFVSQHRNEIIFPFKRYQIQNVWRADRPQKGRFREFMQCDVDIIGSKSLFPEIELIQLVDEIFNKLSIQNVKIYINHRKVLMSMIDHMGVSDKFNDIVILIDKIDKLGIRTVEKEMRRVGVSDAGMKIFNKFRNADSISKISNIFTESDIGFEGINELIFIQKVIKEIGLQSSELVFDISLARGIDYYTGSIFEVKQNDISIGSIAGGGRYDDLTSLFGFNDVSGVGISFGIDRIFYLMDDFKLFPDDIGSSTDVLFLNLGLEESVHVLKMIKKMRNLGIASELYPNMDKVKKQMSYADRKGIKFVAIVGEDEIKCNKISLKNMNTGEQYMHSFNDFLKDLQK
ncbi:MAG: histidine--tRNA ligase [Flavobacteriales bacterium]|nr:histidine--tRNA ligase [Flavobacteriales bacterium]